MYYYKVHWVDLTAADVGLFNPESSSAVGNAIINPLRAHHSDDN